MEPLVLSPPNDESRRPWSVTPVLSQTLILRLVDTLRVAVSRVEERPTEERRVEGVTAGGWW